MADKKSASKKGWSTKRTKKPSVFLNIRELRPDVSVYLGQIDGPMYKDNTRPNTIMLIQENTLASSGAGIINNTFAKDIPSSCTDWSNLDTTYDEYRVLGMKVKYVPSSSNAILTVAYAPLCSVVDRDVITPLVSYAAASNYDSLEEHTLDRKFTRTMKMSGQLDGQWLNTTSLPSVSGAIKFFATGLTNTQVYGRLIVYYLIQFRGRGQ